MSSRDDGHGGKLLAVAALVLLLLLLRRLLGGGGGGGGSLMIIRMPTRPDPSTETGYSTEFFLNGRRFESFEELEAAIRAEVADGAGRADVHHDGATLYGEVEGMDKLLEELGVTFVRGPR